MPTAWSTSKAMMRADMTSNQKNWMVLLASMMVIGLPVLTHLQLNAVNDDSVGLMLRVTARASFLIYLIIFMARPMRQLFDVPLISTIKKNRRYLGIALAGSHTVHLILIAWYFAFIIDVEPPILVLVVGGAAYALLYLMLITSFNRPAAAIGPVAWRRLHKTGLYWLGAIFAIASVSRFLAQPDKLAYMISTFLILLAVGIRIVAFLKNRRN